MNRFRSWWETLTEEEAAYLLAALSFVLCVSLSVTARWLGFHSNALIYLIPLYLLLYGFMQFAIGIWRLARGRALGKLAYSVILLVGGAFTVALSAVGVNGILQVPSSAFPHTRAFVAVLSLPGIVLLTLPFIALLSSPLVLLASIYEHFPESLKELFSDRKKKSVKQGDIVLGVRFITTITLFAALFSAIPLITPYSEWVSDVARWYAYHFEAEKFSYCNLLPNQRIVYLDGDLVIRALPQGEGFSFAVGQCDSPLSTDTSVAP